MALQPSVKGSLVDGNGDEEEQWALLCTTSFKLSILAPLKNIYTYIYVYIAIEILLYVYL